MHKPKFKSLAPFGLLLFSFFLSLIVCELVVRSFFPQKLSYNVSQWDPEVGFVNIRGIKGYSEARDFKMKIEINSKGLRDREFSYEKPDGVYRIGVFGDSFTFGEGVQNEETYSKELERLLRSSGNSVEVLNFGIGKTGTSHQLVWYQKEGKKYHLDLVILGFLSGNDFDDNWGGVFHLENGRLVHSTTPYSSVRKAQQIVYRVPFYKWLATNSHFVNLIRKAVTVYDDQRRNEQGIQLNKNNGAKLNSKYLLTLELIHEFKKEVDQNRSDFLFMNLPTRGQKRYSDPENEKSESEKLSERLIRELGSEKFAILDLLPAFGELKDKMSYYFPYDGHMNAKGHALIASWLSESVTAQHLQHRNSVNSSNA